MHRLLVLFAISLSAQIIPSGINIRQIGGTAVPSGVVDTGNSALKVTCVTGCTSGSVGSSLTDGSTFTAGSTTITGIAGAYDDGLSAVSSGNAAAARITAYRAIHINLRNNSGTEIGTAGTPIQVSLANTAANSTAVKIDGSAVTQPVSGTVTANQGGSPWQVQSNSANISTETSLAKLTQTQGSTTSGQSGTLIQGAVTTSAPSYTTAQTNPLSLTTAGALRVDGSAVTQPVSLTGNQAVNVAQINGVTTTMGNGASGTGVQRVTIASDSTGQVTLAAGAATIGSLTANQSVNMAQINGVAPTMGNGASGTGVQRVTIASDSTGVVGLATGSNTIGALTANQSVNVAQIGGASTSTVASGVQKVGTADSGGTAFLSAADALNSTGGGVQAVQIAGQFDDSSPTAITENRFGNLRMSANRNLYGTIRDAAGNERGANVDSNSNLGVVLAAETTKVLGTIRVLGNAGAIVDAAQNATTPANNLAMGCNFTTSPATITTGNLGAIQCNSKGEILTQLTDGTTSVTVIAGTNALKTDMSSVAGTATATAASGVQKVGIVGNANVAVDAPTDGTAPANALLVGAKFVTSPATLTTGQIGSLQLTSAQNLKMDLTTVAGTAASTAASGVLKVGIVGNAGAIFDAAQDTAKPANNLAMGCNFTTSPATISTGNLAVIQCNSKGEVLSQLTDGTTNVSVISGTNALKTDMSSVAGTATVTAAAGVQKVGIVGNANAAFDAANDAAAPANVLVGGFETATQGTTQPTASSAGNVRRAIARTDGAIYVAPHGPVIWTCMLNAIGNSLTECKAAPASGLSLYITDVVTQSNTSTAGLFTLRYGTGTNCGTGTGNLFMNSASALMASPANTVAVNHFHLTTPVKVTAANALCLLGVATNTTNATITGYTAPG